jgi:hypothetical protein
MPPILPALASQRDDTNFGALHGTTYRLERQLPSGRTENELDLMACERPTAFAIDDFGADAV